MSDFTVAAGENFNENQVKTLLKLGTDLAVATTTTAGVVRKATLPAAAPVPFADLTAAANYVNSIRTALINAGLGQ